MPLGLIVRFKFIGCSMATPVRVNPNGDVRVLVTLRLPQPCGGRASCGSSEKLAPIDAAMSEVDAATGGRQFLFCRFRRLHGRWRGRQLLCRRRPRSLSRHPGGRSPPRRCCRLCRRAPPRPRDPLAAVGGHARWPPLVSQRLIQLDRREGDDGLCEFGASAVATFLRSIPKADVYGRVGVFLVASALINRAGGHPLRRRPVSEATVWSFRPVRGGAGSVVSVGNQPPRRHHARQVHSGRAVVDPSLTAGGWPLWLWRTGGAHQSARGAWPGGRRGGWGCSGMVSVAGRVEERGGASTDCVAATADPVGSAQPPSLVSGLRWRRRRCWLGWCWARRRSVGLFFGRLRAAEADRHAVQVLHVWGDGVMMVQAVSLGSSAGRGGAAGKGRRACWWRWRCRWVGHE